MINDYTKFDSDYMFQVPTHVYIYIYMPSYVSGIDALIGLHSKQKIPPPLRSFDNDIICIACLRGFFFVCCCCL